MPNPPILTFISTSYQQPYYYNPQNNSTSWNEIVPTEEKTPNLADNWVIVPSRKYKYNYFYNTELNISQWQFPPVSQLYQNSCSKIRPLHWTGNSCYLDTTIFSLFINSTIFNDYLLNTSITYDFQSPCGGTRQESIQSRIAIQEELRKITASIRGLGTEMTNIKTLRKLFGKCGLVGEGFCNENTRDAGEVLSYLLSILPNSDFLKVRISTYATNDTGDNPDLILASKRDEYRSVIAEITSDVLNDLPKNSLTHIQNFLLMKDDVTFTSEDDYLRVEEGGNTTLFSRKITETEILSAPIIIFRLHRNQQLNDGKTRIIDVPIIPDETIVLQSSKQTFNLNAITLFHGIHYVCYYVCDNDWYFYNDKPGPGTPYIQKIGSYLDLLNHKYEGVNVQTNGVNYYYINQDNTSPITEYKTSSFKSGKKGNSSIPIESKYKTSSFKNAINKNPYISNILNNIVEKERKEKEENSSADDIKIVILRGEQINKSLESYIIKHLEECFGEKGNISTFHKEWYNWYFAMKDGKILGFLGLDGSYTIWNLCTPEQYRGQGVATKLINRAINDSCSTGHIPSLLVSKIKPTYSKLISYYQKLGFIIDEDIKNDKQTSMVYICDFLKK